MRKLMFLIGLIWSVQLLHATQIEKTVRLDSGYNAIEFDANLTLARLQEKIGESNLLVIQGVGQGNTYKREYRENGQDFLNSFKQTKIGEAYWFKLNDAVIFSYMAEIFLEDRRVDLREGWNFVGAMQALTLDDIRNQLGSDNLLIIQGSGQGKTYKKEYLDNGKEFLNSFTTFEVGQGYWVKVNRATSLNFLFDLKKIAKDDKNNNAEVVRNIDGGSYTIRVYTDNTPATTSSQSTITVVTTVNGERVDMTINGTYPEGTRFQIKIFDDNGEEIHRTVAVDYLGRTIEFPALTIEKKMVTISGTITYDRIPVNQSNNGLDYNAIYQDTAKGIKIDILDSQDKVMKSVMTNQQGKYSVLLPLNTEVKIRIYAQMIQSGQPSWSVKIVDNTNNDALYVLDGRLTTTGKSDSVRDLNAPSSTRGAAPFAILDTINSSIQKVLTANSTILFEPLVVHWSTRNTSTGGDISSGQIGTSFYGDGNLYILGDANGDTDEYDDHVVAHEWGHYYEDKFSRSDSIGGSHGGSERLDIRLAFGEGWGNAFSAMALDNPIYFDTMKSSGWSMNMESASHNNSGWFSESSIQRILYDLYDSHDDETGHDNLSLGFEPIHQVFTGTQKTIPAFTSIFSFIKALKDENINKEVDIDSIVSNENIATINDIYGTGRINKVESYPYHDLSSDSSINIVTNTNNGTSNKLANHQYVKFTIDTEGNYTLKVKQTNGTDSDPDFLIYQTVPFKRFVSSQGEASGVEELTKAFKEGSYIMDVSDYNKISDGKYGVTLTSQ